jgi:acyl carrier protein
MNPATITNRREQMPSTDSQSQPFDPSVGEIVSLLRKIIYLPESSITAQTRLTDLGLDSLDLVEAGLELESLLGRELPENALAEARTVGDLARCFGSPAGCGGLSLAA